MLYQELYEAHYLVQCRSRGRKSIHTDESRHRNWLGPAFNHMAVTAIRKTDIARLIVRMQEAGRAPSSIRSTIGQLGTTLELAVDLGEIDRNPTRGVRTPRVNNRRERFLTAAQIRAFCEHAQNDPNPIGAGKLVLMALGARASISSRVMTPNPATRRRLDAVRILETVRLQVLTGRVGGDLNGGKRYIRCLDRSCEQAGDQQSRRCPGRKTM